MECVLLIVLILKLKLKIYFYNQNNVKNNHRNVFSTSKTEQKNASIIIEQIVLNLTKFLEDENNKISISYLKYFLVLLGYNFSAKAQNKIVQVILEYFQELNLKENYKKMFSLYNDLNIFLRHHNLNLTEENTLKFSIMFTKFKKAVKIGTPSYTNDNFKESMFGVINIFYKTSIPNELYDIVFSPYFQNNEIPAINSDIIKDNKQEILFNNLHLLLDRDLLISYSEKSLLENIAMLKTYFEILPIFEESKNYFSNSDKKKFLKSEVSRLNKEGIIQKINPDFKFKNNLSSNYGLHWDIMFPLTFNGKEAVFAFLINHFGEQASNFFNLIIEKQKSGVSFKYLKDFELNKIFISQALITNLNTLTYLFNSYLSSNKEILFMNNFFVKNVENKNILSFPETLQNIIFSNYLHINPIISNNNFNKEKYSHYLFIKEINIQLILENTIECIKQFNREHFNDEDFIPLDYSILLNFFSLEEIKEYQQYFFIQHFIHSNEDILKAINDENFHNNIPLLFVKCYKKDLKNNFNTCIDILINHNISDYQIELFLKYIIENDFLLLETILNSELVIKKPEILHLILNLQGTISTEKMKFLPMFNNSLTKEEITDANLILEDVFSSLFN